ncbi:cold shock domain-containing protein [Pseudomonas sp. O64]|uniref:cold shock domain-containing protein n=1 Tax=Pseudomonas TaxID=286 RepID=UPI000BA176F0|nr:MULTISPECIES: cold shock domain-containing protein [unclassified Pseudomonas]MCV2228970.1 cold shock domain-containing protein [Pseudomonas sp. AU10]OZO04187.1 DNA-binding protein [Pseudomonas sp. IB20]UNM18350.1 cold shock domain-containing protein [Pseudomonas sp. ArH3a]
MEAVTGTIKSYSQKTGEGWIALDSGEEPVRVDLRSSGERWLKNGQRVQFARIHRPTGIFAFHIKII